MPFRLKRSRRVGIADRLVLSPEGAGWSASTVALACGIAMRIVRRAGGCLLAVGVAALIGCAVGPDFEQPAAPDVTGYTPQPLAEQTSSADVKGGEAQRLVQDLDILGQWWTLFHSAPLN